MSNRQLESMRMRACANRVRLGSGTTILDKAYTAPTAPWGKNQPVGPLMDSIAGHLAERIARAIDTLCWDTGECPVKTREMVGRVKLWHNGVVKSRFGQYRPQRYELEVALQMFESDDPLLRVEYDRTLIHEAGHMLDYFIFGKCGHGKTWQRCMTALDQPNEEVCGPVGVLKMEHRYHVMCSGCKAGWKRHRRMQSNRVCGGCSKKARKEDTKCPPLVLIDKKEGLLYKPDGWGKWHEPKPYKE